MGNRPHEPFERVRKAKLSSRTMILLYPWERFRYVWTAGHDDDRSQRQLRPQAGVTCDPWMSPGMWRPVRRLRSDREGPGVEARDGYPGHTQAGPGEPGLFPAAGNLPALADAARKASAECNIPGYRSLIGLVPGCTVVAAARSKHSLAPVVSMMPQWSPPGCRFLLVWAAIKPRDRAQDGMLHSLPTLPITNL